MGLIRETMLGGGDLCTRQPHTTDTHGGEEGRTNTPTSWCHCVRTCQFNSEVNQFKKQKHTCKKGNGYPPQPQAHQAQ